MEENQKDPSREVTKEVKSDSAEETVTPILEEDNLTAEQELKRGYRLATIGDGQWRTEIKIIRPPADVDRQADVVRAAVFGSLVKNHPDVLTEKEMTDVLQQRGLWTEEKDQEVAEIEVELGRLRNTIYRWQAEVGNDNRDGNARARAKQVEKLEENRSELLQRQNRLNMEREGFFSGTVEALAKAARMDFLMRNCVLDPDTNLPLWKTEEEWREAGYATPGLVFEARTEVFKFWSGLPGTIEGGKGVETFSDGSLVPEQPNSPGE